MKMNEFVMILLLALSGALFAIGGTGFKWARRYVLPAVIVALIWRNAWFWPLSGYFLAIMTALHMGYGERCPYWRKFLIFCGYSFPALLFGFTWWAFVTPVILTILFRLSNWKPTSGIIFWKFWEFLAGVLIATTLIDAIK